MHRSSFSAVVSLSGDSARRDSGGRSTTTDSSTAASRRVPGSRTPHTAIRVRKHRRMRGKRTPVREQAARVLSYDEDSGASDTQEHRINKEELVKAAARQKAHHRRFDRTIIGGTEEVSSRGQAFAVA